ncbi:MAG: hypothetical protein WBL96_04965 [Pseudolabrys sp.]
MVEGYPRNLPLFDLALACSGSELPNANLVTRVTLGTRKRPYYSKLKEEAAMRQTVLTAVVATLLIGTIVEVVAAGGKSVMARHHFYYAAPASGIGIAVPSGMKSFPTEVLPQ